MTKRVYDHSNLIFSVGTQVVALRDVIGQNGRTLHPRGSVGVVVKSPRDLDHSYRIRFPDGVEEALRRDEVVMLARYKEGEIGDPYATTSHRSLYDRIIFRCVIGSRAYGLDDEQSDIDYRGIFLPSADLHWSLYGVPDQIECDQTQEHYWELQRFLVLALKANPNVLECLYTPLVEKATPLAEELLGMREAFLSRLVYQTYNGYVMSQFKKMQADLRRASVRPRWRGDQSWYSSVSRWNKSVYRRMLAGHLQRCGLHRSSSTHQTVHYLHCGYPLGRKLPSETGLPAQSA